VCGSLFLGFNYDHNLFALEIFSVDRLLFFIIVSLTLLAGLPLEEGPISGFS